jgi:hypothetical protein
MFNLEKSISAWRSQMLAAGIRSPVPLDELESHLRDEIVTLVNSGVPEEKAFQVATVAVGEGKALRVEFARARRFRFRDNPPALNFLGWFFILLGIGAILSFARTLTLDWLVPWRYNLYLAAGSYLPFALLIFVGLGLLRRRSLWRIAALLAIALKIFSIISGVWIEFATTASQPIFRHYYLLTGTFVPAGVYWLVNFADAAVMVWGCWFLLGAEGRSLFQRRAPTKAEI